MRVEILQSDEELSSIQVFNTRGERVASLEVYEEGHEIFASSKQAGRVSLSRSPESATLKAYRDTIADLERLVEQLNTVVIAARFG